MKKPITTKAHLVRWILEKDTLMKELGYNSYALRAHQHTIARLGLIKKHPTLAGFINEGYSESGVCDTRSVLKELLA